MKHKIKVNILALNISVRCNMACSRCYGHLDTFAAPPFMDLDTAKRAAELFLAQIPPSGGDFLFFGGEPLLNWGLMEAFIPWFGSLGAPANVRLITVTNGLALSKEKIDFLARHDVMPICLSLDGDYATHTATRPINRQQYDHIVAMMQYALALNPLFVSPYCVLKKENIPATYDILSYIVSLGARYIDLGRDLTEDWTEADRAQVAAQANAVIAEHGVTIQPFTESIFDCTTCYAPSVMVYPNGDIYDACYTVSSVLRYQDLVTEEASRAVMYMGNVHTDDGFYTDVEKKRAFIKPHINCPLIHEDIDIAVARLLQGADTVERPQFRVMDMRSQDPGRRRRGLEHVQHWLRAMRRVRSSRL